MLFLNYPALLVFLWTDDGFKVVVVVVFLFINYDTLLVFLTTDGF